MDKPLLSLFFRPLMLLKQQEPVRKLLLKVDKEFIIKYNFFITLSFTVFIRHRYMTYVSFILGEGAYDPKYFHYRVQRIMIDDHNVPTLR